MSGRLVALDLPGGTAFVDRLRRAWDDGDAVIPIDQRLPPPARRAVLEAMRPALVADAGGDHRVDGGRPVEPGDALVVPTSGSTGEPKGVVLTHRAVAASASATNARLGATADDHWLACLPLAHVGGLSVITRAILGGIPLSVLPRVERAEIHAAVRAGANLVSLVPSALGRIEPSWFRWIVLGGSRPPADRPANTVTTYGMTETGSGVVYDGVPLDGVGVRVGADGVIALRCPMLLRCYRDGHDPKDAGGWLSTGDIGSLDAGGRLHVDGRAAELIITGGENVWPEAVEAVLARHRSVADVAVTGWPDATWGQNVVAVVVPRGEAPSLDELRGHVKESLPGWCAPRHLILTTAIPRSALGKIRRGVLPRAGTPPGRPQRDATDAPPSIT